MSNSNSFGKMAAEGPDIREPAFFRWMSQDTRYQK
jgi:hypothetical protein